MLTSSLLYNLYKQFVVVCIEYKTTGSNRLIIHDSSIILYLGKNVTNVPMGN